MARSFVKMRTLLRLGCAEGYQRSKLRSNFSKSTMILIFITLSKAMVAQLYFKTENKVGFTKAKTQIFQIPRKSDTFIYTSRQLIFFFFLVFALFLLRLRFFVLLGINCFIVFIGFLFFTSFSLSLMPSRSITQHHKFEKTSFIKTDCSYIANSFRRFAQSNCACIKVSFNF